MSDPRVSVIVPAHDEASTVPGLLSKLDDPCFEVVVVCNGCTDGTAQAARRVAPWAKVVEIPEASKRAALIVGDRLATGSIRFYLDADVMTDAVALHALTSRLDQGLCAVAPQVRYDTSRSSWLVRRYYRVLPLLPAVATSVAGTGCIGMSAAGRARFDEWPDVLADDYFADGLFSPLEKERSSAARVTVVAARSVADLVLRRVRVVWGNQDVDSRGLRRHPVTRSGGLLSVLRRHPLRLFDVVVFGAVAVRVRLLVWRRRRRGEGVPWGRDRSRERVVS